MNGQWIQIRSWHVIRTATRMFDTYITLCGRTATGKPADDFGGERTCESCLRARVSPRSHTPG